MIYRGLSKVESFLFGSPGIALIGTRDVLLEEVAKQIKMTLSESRIRFCHGHP